MSLSRITNSVQRIGSTAQGATDVLTRLEGGSFWAQLKPASFRGVPFVVQEGSSHFGRRNQVHEYPYRDTPWVEDLGRQARELEVKGFLVGDDVISQRQAMIDAAERKGDGELVHPTLGKKKVALIDFMTREVWDRGRVFELTFRFIEQGQRQYPTGEKQGQATAKQTGALADLKAAAAFAKKTVSALRTGAAAANEALRQARGWATLARQVQRDATSLVNMAATLPGSRDIGLYVVDATTRDIRLVYDRPNLSEWDAVPVGLSRASGSRIARDASNDRSASAGSDGRNTYARVRHVEAYPPELVAWAKAAMRPLEPTDGSPLCGGRSAKNAAYLQILAPRDGARYARDPDRPLSQQTVPVRVAGTLGAQVRLRLDGRVVLSSRIGEPLSFALSPGEHVLVAEGAGDVRSEAVHVRVD